MSGRDKYSLTILFFVSILIALVIKVVLIISGRFPFNSDEAVVALMARHILQGEQPIFFYGQAYMGSVDAWLVAGGFRLFGEHVWVIRAIQSGLYAIFLVLTAILGREVFRNWQVGVLGTLLLAVPATNITLYTTVSLGGYNEAILIGSLILLSAIRSGASLGIAGPRPYLWFFLTGFLSGLGLWVFGLTLVYSLPAAVYLAALLYYSNRGSQARKLISMRNIWLVPAALGGFLLGSVPWWCYAIEHGFSGLVGELQGGAIAGVEGLPYVIAVGQHLINLVLLGSSVILGARPPWEIRWLGLPMLPLVLVFWMAVGWWSWRRLRQTSTFFDRKLLLVSPAILILVLFVLTPYGADPSGRYFLPLALPMALVAAAALVQWRPHLGRLWWAIVLLVPVYHAWGTIQCAIRFPPGFTTQFDSISQIDQRSMGDLIDFLAAQGETRGYTNYWVSYPLAFLSAESLIFVPRLPYHTDFRYTPRDDRYAPYQETVALAERTAYITTRHPSLDGKIRDRLIIGGVTWQEKVIGDFRVFYRLSRAVRPAELGLGELQP